MTPEVIPVPDYLRDRAAHARGCAATAIEDAEELEKRAAEHRAVAALFIQKAEGFERAADGLSAAA